MIITIIVFIVSNKVYIFHHLQEASDVKFLKIAALHSELIAVSTDGKLHQWKWQDRLPMPVVAVQHSHRRAIDMRLKDEKIAMLDACNVRASVLTESGKVSNLHMTIYIRHISSVHFQFSK